MYWVRGIDCLGCHLCGARAPLPLSLSLLNLVLRFVYISIPTVYLAGGLGGPAPSGPTPLPCQPISLCPVSICLSVCPSLSVGSRVFSLCVYASSLYVYLCLYVCVCVRCGECTGPAGLRSARN